MRGLQALSQRELAPATPLTPKEGKAYVIQDKSMKKFFHLPGPSITVKVTPKTSKLSIKGKFYQI
jgi:hypothetical protein